MPRVQSGRSGTLKARRLFLMGAYQSQRVRRNARVLRELRAEFGMMERKIKPMTPTVAVRAGYFFKSMRRELFDKYDSRAINESDTAFCHIMQQRGLEQGRRVLPLCAQGIENFQTVTLVSKRHGLVKCKSVVVQNDADAILFVGRQGRGLDRAKKLAHAVQRVFHAMSGRDYCPTMSE